MSDPTPLTTDEQKEAIKRKIFAIPCDSKEALHRWILLFLELDIPDCIVDPDSNSSPMDMIYEIYSKARANDPDYSRALFYAARGCFKTLSAAIIELLMVFHLNRNVAHMAAVEVQSHISLGYVRGFFAKLPFRDFVEGDAKGATVILRYINRNDGLTLSKGEYELLSEVEKLPFVEVRNFIKVVVCTMKGANGLHASYFCTDELDVINDIAAFQESLMIPAADRPGVNPISMLTSSRKFSFGLVQKEIDNEFDKDGDRRLHIRHWNIIDVTEACPASRHRPDLPRLPIYLDEPNLVALSQEKYDKLDPDARRKFVEKEGYTGCLTNCKLFASCFAPDTQILMGDGTFRSICQISIGDVIISHTGARRRVTEVMSRPYSGPALSVRHGAWAIDTIVTPEHPYFINGNDFVEASRMQASDLSFTGHVPDGIRTPNDFLSLPSGFSPTRASQISLIDFIRAPMLVHNHRARTGSRTERAYALPVDIQITEDFAWTLGFFLAEGSFGKHARGGKRAKNSLCFSSHVKEVDFHARLHAFAESFGLPYKTSPKSARSLGAATYIYGSTMADLFSALCGEYCDEKKIHPSLLDMDLKVQAAILNGVFDGDGKKGLESRSDIDITGRDLASQLFLIASRLGLCPRFRTLPPIAGKRQSYQVSWNRIGHVLRHRSSVYKFENGYNQYRLDDSSVTAYAGEVFNLEVEEDHSYIADGVAVHNCRGFLATEQKSTSPLLRSISFTQAQFRTVSVPTANAQLLCRKPSTEGLIYPHLERSIHMLTPAQIVQKITGETVRPDMTKAELIVFLKLRGVRFAAGMDFGFKHNFAVPLAAIDGARAFVIACISAPELLPDAMIHKCDADIKSFNPSIWPDTASPQLIAMFKKSGYRMREWNKGSGSVNDGIDIVCMRLRPTLGEPLLYFLAGDPGVEVLYKNMSQYHWTIDSQGDPTDVPDEEDDDECDGLRYLVMNEFPPNKRIVSAPANDAKKAPPTPLENFRKHTANWFQKWKEDNGIIEGGPDGQSGKKGGFKYAL